MLDLKPYRALALALLIFFLQVPAQASDTSASDTEWLDNLPIKPGSSTGRPKTDEIDLMKKFEFKHVEDRLFLSGRGCVSMDDEEVKLCPQDGVNVEVTFDGAAKAALRSCDQYLNADIPEHMQIVIIGQGKYKVLEASKTQKETIAVLEFSKVFKCTFGGR